MTIKQHKYQVPDKSENFYKINQKVHFWGKSGLFKIKNRLVNKSQEVRGQVRTTFSEAPNSGLTTGKKICCSMIKTCVI